MQPKWPYCRKHRVERLPPFFAVNEPLPLLLALILGFQHAAAMVGGIVLGPILVTASNTDPNAQVIMACASPSLPPGYPSGPNDTRFFVHAQPKAQSMQSQAMFDSGFCDIRAP